MNFPAFLKKKRTYVVAIAILAVGGFLYARSRNSDAVTYETAAAERKDLIQTVEVTGEIRPAARIDLSFKSGGAVQAIKVKVGDQVKTGQVLAQLKDDDVVFAARSAAAALSIARANLNSRLAGETSQSIRVAETQVEQAQANYDKAKADLESTKQTTRDSLRTAQIALETAQNNLNNQGSIVNQNVQNAYDSARTSLLTALGPLNAGLRDGDEISGVDNTAANQNWLSVLGFLDSGTLPRAKSSYSVAKSSKETAEKAVKELTASSTREQIQSAAMLVQTAIEQVQSYLLDVQKVLTSSLTSSYFTQATLDSKKATIDADRTTISAQNTTVLSALQSIKGTELTQTQTSQQLQDAYQTAKVAFMTAETNVTVQVRSAETAMEIQRAGLEASKASLDLKRAGPRGVDVEPLRASVEQAAVAAEKAANDLGNIQIVSPVDGVVSEVLPDIGEQVNPNAVAIKMIGTSSFDIEAEVPEADIAKIVVGQAASITLDAYGDDVKFMGTVTAKDPAETKVQDATYYKIRVMINPGEREVKPGMTANVTVTTNERKGTLVIPLRAVRTKSGTVQKTVRVLIDGKPQERDITIGVRGDEGRVEVLSGLNEGDQVVVAEVAAGLPK